MDLRYRGDYQGSTMAHIQTHIVNNDFEKFKAAMVKKSNWSTVPVARFDLRVNFLKTAKAPAKSKSTKTKKTAKSKSKP